MTLSTSERAVLQNVSQGRSPWLGWQAGTKARTPEGQAAYEDRARAITAFRVAGWLTYRGLLTDAGRATFKAMVVNLV